MRDVIVVGAGAHGAATAWQLARRGRDVLAIDRFEAGHTNGSSHGSSRIFRLAHSDPRDIALAQTALAAWRELEEEAQVQLLDSAGSLEIGPASVIRDLAVSLASAGVEHDRLGPSEIGAAWPAFAPAAGEAAVFQPDGARVRSAAALTALHRRAEAHGAELRFGETVLRIEPRAEEVVVFTSTGEQRARGVVVAAGPWARDVVGDLITLPSLRVTQEQVFHFDGPADLPVFLWDDFYGVATPGEGVKVGEHGTGAEVHPDWRDRLIDDAGRQRVVEFVTKRAPGLDPSPHSETTCLYTTAPNDERLISTGAGIVAVSACSGMGFKFTPVIGSLAADAVEGSLPSRRPRIVLPKPW